MMAAETVALVEALDPADPATFVPLVRHTTLCYTVGLCPVCLGALVPPRMPPTPGLTIAGTCPACHQLFMIADATPEPAALSYAQLVRIRLTWLLLVFRYAPPQEDPPCSTG